MAQSIARTLFLIACLLAGLLAATDAARAADTLFNPARHIALSEVKPGMKGYGLTVLKGTTPERFEVEVVSILHNQMSIQADVILVRCKGANLEHTGAIAGMSGSPIYLTDAKGRSRLAGAFAYGWPLAKDPIGGVQPIEYMLKMAESEPATQPATRPAGDTAEPAASTSPATSRDARPLNARWNLPEALALLAQRHSPADKKLSGGLRPMMVPLMASGLDQKALSGWGGELGAMGLTPMQAAGAVAAARPGDDDPGLSPGSVMVVPLLQGDAQLAAVGTCTEVLGDRVFGFGHPFSNDGLVALPVGSGQISLVVASLSSSFKLGSMTKMQGTLFMDQQNGVAGRLGKSPALVPIEMNVRWAAGGETRTFRFQVVQHPRITPVASAMAMMSAVTGRKALPQFHTLEYEMEARFSNGRVVKLSDVSVNSDSAPVNDMAQLLGLVMDNPFGSVELAGITGTVRISPESRQAGVLSVNMPKLTYKPGETARLFVTVQPFRAAREVLPIDMEIPGDLPAGTYQLAITDRDTYLRQEMATRPFRFSAESVSDMFGVLDTVTKLRADALYVRLVLPPDGVAIGRTAMPGLPSSRRQILMGAGRANTTAFATSSTKIVPTAMVMSGSADFQITIETDGKGTAHGVIPPRQPTTRP